VKILKERRERDLFLIINSALSSTKRTPTEREREQRERGSEKFKSETHQKIIFSKKKTRSFLHTPGSLLLARAHERVNIT